MWQRSCEEKKKTSDQCGSAAMEDTAKMFPSGKVDEATTSTVQSSSEGAAEEVDVKEDMVYYNEAMEEVTIKEESVDCIIGNAAEEEDTPSTPLPAQWYREPSPPAEGKRLLPLDTQPNGDIRVTVTNLEAIARACRQEQDEFDLFGKTVAAHLRQLPLRPALAAQCNIQQVLADARLTAQKEAFLALPPRHQIPLKTIYDKSLMEVA